MLISDLEQLEILSECNPVKGGLAKRNLSLNLANRRITLKLNNQPLLSETLTIGKPISSAFTADELSGLLTATYAEENNKASKKLTLTGSIDTIQFNLALTSISLI